MGLGEEIRDLILKNTVILFAYSYCPYAQRITELLSKMDIEFTIIYIDKYNK